MGLIVMSEEEKKNLREFLLLKVQNQILRYSDGDIIVHECPKCKTRYPFNIGRPMGVDAVVNFIMEIQEESDAVKIALLNMMKNKLDNLD